MQILFVLTPCGANHRRHTEEGEKIEINKRKEVIKLGQ